MILNTKMFTCLFLTLLCQLAHEAAAMKPLFLTTAPMVVSSDDDIQTVPTVAASMGQRSYDNQLGKFGPYSSEDDEVTMYETAEEDGWGYLANATGKLAKFKKAGYEKMLEAGESVDTRFVAGAATALTLSVVVWLITSAVKKDKVRNKTGASNEAPELLKEVEATEAFACTTRLQDQAEEKAQHSKAEDRVAQLIEAREADASEITHLKQRLLLLEKSIEVERAAKEELSKNLETVMEEKEATIKVNRVLLETHTDPEGFLHAMQSLDK